MENHKGFTGAEPVGRLALRVSYLEGALLNRMPSIAEPRANICYQPILAVFLYFIFIYNLVSYQFFLLSTFSFDTVLLIMFDLFSSQVEPVSHKPLDWDTSWSTTFLVIFTFRTMWVYYMCYTGCFAFYIYIYYTLYGNPSLRWVSLAEPFVWFLITLFPKNPPRFVVWWSCFSARR